MWCLSVQERTTVESKCWTIRLYFNWIFIDIELILNLVQFETDIELSLDQITFETVDTIIW